MAPAGAVQVRHPSKGGTVPRRWRPARIGGLAVVVAALAVGGCGTSSSSNTAARTGASTPAGSTSNETSGSSLDTSPDPCALLTADQVAKAIGMKVSAGTPRAENLSDSHDCTWSTAYGEGADYSCAKDVTGVVLVVVAPPPALKERYPTAQSYFADLLATKRATGSVQQVSGIGDGAFAATSAANKGLDVYATKGNVILRVFSNCGSPTTLRPELENFSPRRWRRPEPARSSRRGRRRVASKARAPSGSARSARTRHGLIVRAALIGRRAWPRSVSGHAATVRWCSRSI